MADQVADIDEVRLAAGREILRLTDRFGFDAFAAGWLHDRESGAWRYLLVTPMLKTRGPHWVYERLLRLFRYRPLPEGITPLDIHVVDPDMEIAAFGEPFLAIDEREIPAGVQVFLAHDVRIKDFLVGDGFVAFYRRLPIEQRQHRGDPARQFDMRVRQLDRAA
jgi:hypothetical protein